MAYIGPDFVNGGPPAINAANLNGMVDELERCSAMDDVQNYNLEPFDKDDWVQGTITNSGSKTTSEYRIRFKNDYVALKNFKVSNIKGYTLNIFKYNADGTLKSQTGFPSDDTITEYSISEGDIINIVLSKYPTTTTTTNDYNKILYIGLTKYDKTVIDVAENTERLDDLESEIVSRIFTYSDFEVGALSAGSGGKVVNQYRIRLKETYHSSFDFSITNKPGYNYNLFKFDASGTMLSNSGYVGNDTPQTLNVSAGEYVNIVIYKYPLSPNASVNDFDGIDITGCTKFEVIEEQIVEIESKISQDGTNNEVTSNANFFENADISYLTTKYYVGKSGDYQTINSALSAWANANYPPAVVFIGESKDGTIIRTKTGEYTYPPFKIHHGNVLIANLTAIADHSANPSFAYTSGSTMAYAIHIDGGNIGGNVVVRNCKAVSYQSPAFGMGLIPNSRIRFENVEAYTYTEDTTNSEISLKYGCILCHMPAQSKYPSQTANDNDMFDMVNVKAYAKNSEKVIYLSQGDSPALMTVCAINTITASGKTTDGDSMLSAPTQFNLDRLSIGNTIPKLNN